MQHHEIDPSLCAAEPRRDSLDDGFSPPVDLPVRPQDSGGAETPESALTPKSPF